MTGSVSVSSAGLLAGYRLITIGILALFAIYDIRHHRVKNAALLWFLPWCLFSLPVYCQASALPLSFLVLKAALGLLSGGLLLLTAAMLTQGGIGGGDIKLTALLGFLYGTPGICTLLFLSCVPATAFCLFLKIKKVRKPTGIPFVPFLFLGTLLFQIV